jgi:uncharacterized LabA/DUF88 family protein
MKKNKNPEIYLFIDGSNFYAGQYQLFGPEKYLSFSEFIKQAEFKLKIAFSKIYFYTSYSPVPKKPTKKQKQYLKNEALFYKNVKRTKNVIFFKGYRSKTSGKEKEVDVKLAVDIVDFAHKNRYKALYLLSGDADFMHALKIAQKLSKKITILSLENRIPYRFSYIYQTYVFLFFKLKQKISPKQKIKIIKLSPNNLIMS